MKRPTVNNTETNFITNYLTAKMTNTIENSTSFEDPLVKRAPRKKKLVKIRLLAGQAFSKDTVIHNISDSGICAKIPAGLTIKPGQTMDVDHNMLGTVSGVIRWVNDGKFGMEFDELINSEQLNFSAQNSDGHFVKKIDNGHVWKGFKHEISTKRPSLRTRN